MQIINYAKHLADWNNNSSKASGYREQMGALMMALGGAGTGIAEKVISSIRDAQIDTYLSDVEAFHQTCHPLYNNASRIECDNNFPQAPPADSGITLNVLSALSLGFQGAFILIVMKSLYRTYSAGQEHREPPDNQDTVGQINETSSLLPMQEGTSTSTSEDMIDSVSDEMPTLVNQMT